MCLPQSQCPEFNRNIKKVCFSLPQKLNTVQRRKKRCNKNNPFRFVDLHTLTSQESKQKGKCPCHCFNMRVPISNMYRVLTLLSMDKSVSLSGIRLLVTSVNWFRLREVVVPWLRLDWSVIGHTREAALSSAAACGVGPGDILWFCLCVS